MASARALPSVSYADGLFDENELGYQTLFRYIRFDRQQQHSHSLSSICDNGGTGLALSHIAQ